MTVVGCVAPKRTFQPPADPATLDDAAFLHYLAAAPTVTVAEGARAVLLITGPSTNWPTYDAQRERLRELGAIRDEWELAPDQTLDHGTLAFMLTQVCHTRRGINEHLSELAGGLGDRRYALKSCIDLGLVSYHLPHDPVAGGELVSALRKAETWPLRSAASVGS